MGSPSKEIPDEPRLISTYANPHVENVVFNDYGTHWDAEAYNGEGTSSNHCGCWYKDDYTLEEVMGWLSKTYPNAKIKATKKTTTKTWGKSDILDFA